jgi:hypothetical protein
MEAMIAALAGLFKPDERFIEHRYRSTRLSMIVGAVLMAGWFEYELLANHHLRWDLLIILTAMAVAKAAAMIYLRLTR